MTELERLQQVSTQLIAAGYGEALYEQIVDAGMEIVRADFASLQALGDKEGQEGELLLLSYRAAASRKSVRPTSTTCSGMALRTRERVTIADVETSGLLAGSADREILRQAGIRATQSTPLLARSGERLGVFSTYWGKPHELTAAEIHSLDVLARMAADLLARGRAVRRLRESEESLRLFVENVREYALVQTDLGGSITRWNRGAERLFGYARGETLGKPLAMVLAPEDRPDGSVENQVAAIKAGRRSEDAGFLARRDGRRFRAHWVAEPISDDKGEILGAAIVVHDETERLRAVEVELQRQKLESVGLLAGGIAHDFNNLLTSIMGNASLVVNEIPAQWASHLRVVIETAEVAAGLIRQLLAYSGKDESMANRLNVAEVVHETGALVQFSIPKSVQLSVAAEQRLPPVRADRAQLQQILMNLAINAGEAIGEGNAGRIKIGTTMADIDEVFTDALGQEMTPGRYIVVEVRDTGSGMDAAILPKIFDPFFTTKFIGRGLGLAAVAGMIRGQRGAVTVESTPGRGSTFRVFLPAAKDLDQEAEGEQDAILQATVLVVDDELTVRDFVAAALRQRGYRVLTAGDGREAVGILEERGLDAAAPAVDAVVLDLIMPVMSAREFLPVLRERWPETKVLLTSGYNEAEAKQLGAGQPGIAFLQKPYTAQRLGEAITDLLEAEQKQASAG
jgi:PAS domain S-box-containing protein